MKILLGAWILLFLRIKLNSGHYIRSAGEDDSTVYEVKDGSGVTFVNPKAAQPTLREILYYHIIERPYAKETPNHQEPTERSFTNSHGYQFLDYDGEPSSGENTELLHELIKELEEQNEEDHHNVNHDENEVDLGLHQEEEETEVTTEPNPLTDEEVKEAYKTRSYLFDQARQIYLPKRMVPVDAVDVRRKRQADFEAVPQSPQLSGDAEKDAYIQPKTYGMNLNPDGGYVWNNLNNPATYYEVEQPPNGDQSGGQNQPQSQEPTQPPAEIYNPPAPAPENSNSDSSEDIYVNTDRLPAVLPSDNEGSNEKAPTDIYEESEASKESLNEESAEIPIPPKVNESQESNESGAKYPTDTIINENVPEAQDESAPVVEKPEQVDTAVNPGSNEDPGGEPKPQYEQPASEVEKASGDSNESEGEKIREIPEAPTLPPLNYDNLPDYIRQAISSTEKTESNEQTDNPYVNPQLNAEEKKEIEDKMEGIFATVQPVEDIPKTYGMNLTSDGGHVWNDLVNPPVSYDVGSTTSNQEQEATQAPAISEQPEIQNPSEEPSSPEENKDSEEANVAGQPETPEPSQEEVIPNDNNAQIEQPAEPIEPKEPSEPIEPIAPEQPTEPKEPESEAELPAEPEISLEPTEPKEPESEAELPAEPEISLEPTEPKEPESEAELPAEPEIPLEPTEPKEPESEAELPAEPEIPLEPTEPKEPESEAELPAEPEISLDPTEPKEPESEAELPAEPEIPLQPTEPKEPESEAELPAEPEIPLEPTEPKEPESEAELPAEPEIPLEPTEPKEPESEVELPAEPEIPLEPTEPKEPESEAELPAEPEIPLEPTEPKEPESEAELPAEPEISLDPTEPKEPESEAELPAEPEIPLQPTEPKEPESEAELPAEPEIPLEPTEPKEPESEAELPAEPEISLDPTEPKEPESEAELPAEPEISLEPTEPIIPAEPESPVEPVTPDEPKNPEANVPEPGSDESEDIPKPNESGPSEESDLPEEEEQDLAHPKPEDDDNKPDIMSELLKSEQFWKWLGEWTATYMELLEKHIRKIAIQEICNREKLGSQICLLDDQPEESGPIINDGKLFIDDREISLTHSDNLASSRKRGHQEDKGHKTHATTIYGNSVGNEKVTNVFIFNPDNAKEIIEELKPENDSKVDFTVDERIKEEIKKPEEDKEGKVIEAEKDKDEEKGVNGDKIVSEKESGDDKKEDVEDVKEINEQNKAVSSELNKHNEDEQGKPVEA